MKGADVIKRVLIVISTLIVACAIGACASANVDSTPDVATRDEAMTMGIILIDDNGETVIPTVAPTQAPTVAPTQPPTELLEETHADIEYHPEVEETEEEIEYEQPQEYDNDSEDEDEHDNGSDDRSTDSYNDDDVSLLARVLWAEAGGCSWDCQRLVASTVLNLADYMSGSDLSEIVYDTSVVYISNDEPSSQCYEVARAVLAGDRDYNVMAFRSWYYHDFGTPYTNIDDVYFSTF